MGRKTASSALIVLGMVFLLTSCGEFVGFRPAKMPDIGDLPEFHLYVSTDEMGYLYDSVTKDISASCHFNDGSGVKAGSVNVRGRASRMHPKKSFTVTYEENGDTVKLALDAGGRPWFGYGLAMYTYDLMGLLPAPQLTPVGLFLNGEYLGYYNSIPLYDESLNDYFGESGSLFKIFVFDMGRDVPVQGDSEKKFPDNDDFSLLNRLFVNAAYMNHSDWLAWINVNVDLERMAAYLAVRDFLGVGDTANTNFYVYIGNRALVLPWDNDHAFTYLELGGFTVLTRRMFESEEFRTYYNDFVYNYFLDEAHPEQKYILDDLRSELDRLAGLLDEPARNEPVFYLDYASFLNEKANIENFLSDPSSGHGRAYWMLNTPVWTIPVDFVVKFSTPAPP